MPKSEKGKETLRKFIVAVNPDTILFSIAPETKDVKFSPTDFADANSFAIRLISAKDALSRSLLETFGDSTRQRLRSVDRKGVTEELRQALAHELTRIIQGPLLYREDLFAGVDLTGIRPLKSTLTDAESALINRELLERAYPREIGEVRGQHVEKVKSYLRQYLPDRKFNIVITAQDGDAEIMTQNRKAFETDIYKDKIGP